MSGWPLKTELEGKRCSGEGCPRKDACLRANPPPGPREKFKEVPLRAHNECDFYVFKYNLEGLTT